MDSTGVKLKFNTSKERKVFMYKGESHLYTQNNERGTSRRSKSEHTGESRLPKPLAYPCILIQTINPIHISAIIFITIEGLSCGINYMMSYLVVPFKFFVSLFMR